MTAYAKCEVCGKNLGYRSHRKLVHTSNFGFISLHLSKGLTIFYFLKNLGKPGCLGKKKVNFS